MAHQQAPVGPLGRTDSEAVSRELFPAMPRAMACRGPRPWWTSWSTTCCLKTLRERSRSAPAANQCLKVTSFLVHSPRFNNPLAERLDPRAFRFSFQLFQSRASKIEFLGQAFDASTGQPIPTLRSPRSPFRVRVQRREDREPDIDSEESVSELEIQIPLALRD